MLTGVRLNSKLVATISLALLLAVPFGCHAQSGNMSGNQRVASNPDKTDQFDAERAYEHVRKLVALGPHPSGSEGIRKAQDYIEQQLKSYGLQVSFDSFSGETPRGA